MPERKRKFFAQSPEARRAEARSWVGKDAIITIGKHITSQSRFDCKVVELLHLMFVGDLLVLEGVQSRFAVRLTDISGITKGWGDKRDAVVAPSTPEPAWADPEEPF